MGPLQGQWAARPEPFETFQNIALHFSSKCDVITGCFKSIIKTKLYPLKT